MGVVQSNPVSKGEGWLFRRAAGRDVSQKSNRDGQTSEIADGIYIDSVVERARAYPCVVLLALNNLATLGAESFRCLAADRRFPATGQANKLHH